MHVCMYVCTYRCTYTYMDVRTHTTHTYRRTTTHTVSLSVTIVQLAVPFYRPPRVRPPSGHEYRIRKHVRGSDREI